MGRVEASIRAMEQAIEETEAREEGEYRLPERLQEAQPLCQAIRASLERMQEVKRDHLHPREQEARMLPCEDRKEMAYNAQVAVDGASELIVAAEVVNEESDNRRLVPMLDEVIANVGQVAEATVADGGYKSSVALGEAEQKDYGVLVKWGGDASGKQPGPYHKSRFHHQADEDVVICPRGERLEFEAVKTNRWKRFAVRGYRCRSFPQCAVREACSRNRQGRLIEISPYDAAVARQRAHLHDPEKQQLLKQPKVTVEPILGVIKQDSGFRRWMVRGLENVRTQWSLLCATFNLKRMHRAWAAGQLSLAPA